MGQVRVGTASWTDRTLLESGWYPPEADTPQKRLRYYARQVALVEVDAHLLRAARRADRGPVGGADPGQIRHSVPPAVAATRGYALSFRIGAVLLTVGGVLALVLFEHVTGLLGQVPVRNGRPGMREN